MDNPQQLVETKVSRLLLKFSIPAIIAMLVSSFYNVIDRIFIGHSVGSIGIAGVTIAFPVMIIQLAFGLLIGMGATSLVSIKLGEQKKEEAELIMGNALTLLIIISIIITIAGLIFIDPILIAFGASSEVLPYAKDFLTIIIIGSVFMSAGFGMNNFIRAEGKPQKAMVTMLIGTALNIILAPVFLFVFKWGMKGAALATVLSQFVSFIWVISHFLNNKSILKIRLKNLKPKMHIAIPVIMIGLAPFAMQLAASLLNVIMNKSLEIYGGDVAISSMGAVTSILMLIIMPVVGISQGAQPIIGYNYGAKRYDRVKETLKLAIIASTVISIIGFIFTRIAPTQLMAMFNSADNEFIELGRRGITIFLLFLPIVGFQVIGSNYFQAVGKAKQAMILILSRQVIILVPALLILPKFFKLDGIYYSGPIADLLSTIITGIWLIIELKHLTQKHEDSLVLELSEQS
jgi:putative MATE family efflux protein